MIAAQGDSKFANQSPLPQYEVAANNARPSNGFNGPKVTQRWAPPESFSALVHACIRYRRPSPERHKTSVGWRFCPYSVRAPVDPELKHVLVLLACRRETAIWL